MNVYYNKFIDFFERHHLYDKEMFDYLDGLTTLEECVTRIQSNTRRYMRKQETWLKRDKEIKWFSPNDVKEIIKYIDCCFLLAKNR